jgi:hypothetical protein
MVILRVLGYVGVAALAGWIVGWWATEDCVRDYAATGGDGGLCGLGWLAAPPTFVGVVVVAALVGELVLVPRMRAARMRP